MQEPEDKKVTGRHAAPETEPAPSGEDDVLRADTELYGDEADVPLRRRKKKTVSASKKKKAGKGGKKKSTLLAFLKANPEKAHFRKKQPLFEIVRTEDSRFRTVMINGRKMPMWPLIALAALLLSVSLVFMNNSNINAVEQTVTIVGLPEDLENYRMLVISDLNGRRFGDEQSALLRTINNLDYDSVFFLGDMVGKEGDAEPFYELLEGIPSSKEMYFICGDSDPGPYVDSPRNITGTLSQIVLEDWILGAIERGAVYVDSPVCLTVGSSNIWITPSTLMNLDASSLLNTWKEQTEQEEEGVLAGLDADYQTLPATTYRYRIAQNFYNALSAMSEDDFYLSLSHQVPSDSFIYASAAHDTSSSKYISEPELVLAGHYCGGVWRLPILGAFYVPDNMLARNGWFPNQSDVKGLSTVGESQVYITGGLSTNSDTPVMSFRLFNQPEIAVLNLTATLPESMLTVQ